MSPKYRIVNIETGYVWYSDDDDEAYRLSFENDKYDVEELRPPRID